MQTIVLCVLKFLLCSSDFSVLLVIVQLEIRFQMIGISIFAMINFFAIRFKLQWIQIGIDADDLFSAHLIKSDNIAVALASTHTHSVHARTAQFIFFINKTVAKVLYAGQNSVRWGFLLFKFHIYVHYNFCINWTFWANDHHQRTQSVCARTRTHQHRV